MYLCYTIKPRFPFFKRKAPDSRHLRWDQACVSGHDCEEAGRGDAPPTLPGVVQPTGWQGGCILRFSTQEGETTTPPAPGKEEDGFPQEPARAVQGLQV